MDRYRYFIFNQMSVLALGLLQIGCAGLCLVCGIMDAAFRKSTPLSTTRTPLWGGLVRYFLFLSRTSDDVFLAEQSSECEGRVNKRRRYSDGDEFGEDISAGVRWGPKQEFTIILHSKRTGRRLKTCHTVKSPNPSGKEDSLSASLQTTERDVMIAC